MFLPSQFLQVVLFVQFHDHVMPAKTCRAQKHLYMYMYMYSDVTGNLGCTGNRMHVSHVCSCLSLSVERERERERGGGETEGERRYRIVSFLGACQSAV